MKPGIIVGLVVFGLAVPPLGPAAAQSPAIARRIDAEAEINAVLFAASATQEAAQRAASKRIRDQRAEIEGLRKNDRQREAAFQSELARKEKEFITALAAQDRAYAREIEAFRNALSDIAATPEGLQALARFNAGDELGALAALDGLAAAREAARKARADIETAAEKRRIAILALQARNKGKLDTAAVIARFQDVTRLDPNWQSDWIELARLYQTADAQLPALAAITEAMRLSDDLYGTAVSVSMLADGFRGEGALSLAASFYGAALRNYRIVAEAAPSDTRLQFDVAACLNSLGRTQLGQGKLTLAMASFEEARTILAPLVSKEAEDVPLHRELATSIAGVGDVHLERGKRAEARQAWKEAQAVIEPLALADISYYPLHIDYLDLLLRAAHEDRAEGELAKALVAYQVVDAIYEHHLRADLSNLVLVGKAADLLEFMGLVLVAQADGEGARDRYLSAAKMRALLAEREPGNRGWTHAMALSTLSTGDLFVAAGRDDSAFETYRQGAAILEPVVALDETNAQWARTLFTLYSNIAAVKMRQEKQAEAVEPYRKSLAIAERLAAVEPSHPKWRREVWRILWKLRPLPGSGVTWSDIAKRMEDQRTQGFLSEAEIELLRTAGKGATEDAAKKAR